MNIYNVNQDYKFFSKMFTDKSLSKKASLNILALALDHGSRLIVSFIITPLLVSGLGEFFFGVWQVLKQLVGQITPAGGRATQALKWTIAKHKGSTDYEKKRRYIGSTLVVWLIFLPLLTVLGGLLAWFAPFWLDVPKEFIWSVRLAAGLLVAGLIVKSLVEIPRSILEGENLGYKRMGMSAILVFIGGGFTWLALILKTGIVGVATCTLATVLLTGLLFLYIARIYTPWFAIAKPSFEEVRKFLKLSWWFLAWNVVLRVMMASDAVVLGVFDSAEIVTIYSITKIIPKTLILIIAIMVFGISPGLGAIIGSGNLKKATRLRSEMILLTWLVITGIGSTVLLWNWAFIRLWIGEEYYAGVIPTLLIVVVFMQFVLIRIDASIIDLTLRLGRKVLIGSFSVSISLAVACALVSYFNLGISGLCLGFIAGRFILSIAYPIMICRFLKVSMFSQLKGILRPAFVTTLLLLLTFKLSDVLATSNWSATIGWINLIVSAGITSLATLLFAFYAGLSGEQRNIILQRIRKVITIAPD